MASDLPDAPPRPLDRVLASGVLLAAVALAALLYASFWNHSREVWWWPQHDRHAHYLHGLNLALDLEALDLRRVRHDLEAPRVWGPLHCVLVAACQLVGGPDHRLAVLPSLAGWALTVWLSFLVARRMLPQHGNAAGLAAAAVVAALPGHRAFATDVMLESLGAALSLAALYWYLVAVQDRARRAGVGLAVSLLLLFFHKYNYWLLVVLGLAAGEFLRQPRAWLSAVHTDGLLKVVYREARQPLSWIAFLLFIAALLVWKLKLHEPHGLFTVAWWAVAARLLLWWRATGRSLAASLDPRLRPVLVWHGFAAALWFALPRHLGNFLWFVSPANSNRPFTASTPLDGLVYYFRAVADDYSAWPREVYALLVLVPLTILLVRNLRPGSAAVLAFFLLSAALTTQHAMTKERFAHSWIAAGWVLAAVGGFTLLRRGPGWLAGVVSAAVVAVHLPAYLDPGHAAEAGRKPELACPLAISDAYLPHVGDAQHTTIFSNIPARFFFSWTFLEAHPRKRFAAGVPGFKEKLEHDAEALTAWLRQTPSDALVLIEAHPRSPLAVIHRESPDLTTLAAVLERQQAFTRQSRQELPEGVSISLWRKSRDSR